MPINNSKINISHQEEFIRQRGEWVNYSVGMKCTCASSMMMTGSNLPDSNRANPNCKACHGLGIVWIPQGIILGLVENINQNKDLIIAGLVAPGDLVFSPDLRYTLSDYDKIQMTWTEGIPFEGQLVTRSSSATDTTYYDIEKVNRLSVFDVTAGTETKYDENTDFTYQNNVITWIAGHGPASGTVYSLKYQALIDWIVFAPPQPRRERGTNLGQRLILKKKHVVFNGF